MSTPTHNRIALRTALIYLIGAELWILLSDWLVWREAEVEHHFFVNTEVLKGSLFVLVTSVALYLVLRYQLRLRHKSEAQSAYQANILQHVSDAIFAVDLDRHILTWNPGAEQIYGWRADEVIGKPIREMLRPVYPDMTVEEINAVFQEKQTWIGELIQHHKDGHPLHIVANVSYLRDDTGKPIGMVTVNRDVSDQKRLEKEILEKEKLTVALETERRVQEIRTRFMRMISHEFRTPLTIINSSYDLLKSYNDRMSPEQRMQKLDNIAEQVTHLRDLMGEVSLLLSTDPTMPNFAPTEFDLVPYCEDQITEIRRACDTHTVNLLLNCDSARINGDSKLLRHVVNNLIYNAIKYSPEGSPITVTLEVDRTAVLRVKDLGIGIPDVDCARIFEPFYRATNVNDTPGSGLGLAIVKQIVDLHQGKIDVQSQVGVGTTFTVTLPLMTTA
jgi:PAS domain S-box-containing protein